MTVIDVTGVLDQLDAFPDPFDRARFASQVIDALTEYRDDAAAAAYAERNPAFAPDVFTFGARLGMTRTDSYRAFYGRRALGRVS